MMNSNLNLSALPECKFAYQMVNSALLIPCAEYQRVLHVEKVAHIAENFSEHVANEPKVSFRDGRFYIFDGQNTVEARRTCNGGMELPIRCKVFYGLTKEDEATLFAIQTGNATCLTAGERLRANLVTEQLEISQRGHLLCRHGAAYRLGTGRETPCGSSAEQHWKPSFAYIDRCNCYHPDGKEEKPAHPCAGGFQPGL